MKRKLPSEASIRQLLGQQENRCKNCSKVLSDRESFHVDHITPLKDKGSDNYNNLQILCINCHVIKTSVEGGSLFGLTKKKDSMEQCEICGKVIRGFSNKHTDYLMKQHNLTHPYSEEVEDEKIK